MGKSAFAFIHALYVDNTENGSPGKNVKLVFCQVS